MPRKKSRSQFCRWAGMFFLVLLPLLSHAQAKLSKTPTRDPGAFRTDRILIIPKAGHEAALANLHQTERGQVRRKFSRLGNVHVIDLPKGSDVQAVIRRYLRSGHVEVAEPDHLWRPAAAPNDPFYVDGTLWHLNNTGQNFGTPDADIDAPEAWDTLNSASNIIVAVLDTGVRYTHDDLAANMWVNPGETDGNHSDDDADGYVDDVHGIDAVANTGDPNDDVWGHGTHVAGILGAVGNNSVGVCGVAWRIKIMACKFIGPSSGSDSDLMEAMDYARVHGARVLNCSFVAPGPFSVSLSNAFWNIRNAGIIVVAAAGNSGINHDATPYYPASFRMDNIVAVAATTRTDSLWAFSDYGPTTVHLAAPGAEILSTWNSANDAYAYDSGTSMATPMVAGTIALMLARFPTESYQQIIARLLAATDPLPSLAGKCISGGRLNTKKALDLNTYTIQPALYDWVPTNGMTFLSLANNGVSSAQTLPFAFNFYARNYNQIFIGANGLLGFTNVGMSATANSNLPDATAPNAAIYPYWDDLNPAAGGSVWFGQYGQAPNRKAVFSWVEVPQNDPVNGPTPFTFQAILHESGPIAFQYQQVEAGNTNLFKGKSATIGLEDPSGLFATKFAYGGSPSLVTNNQALLLLPSNASLPPPTLTTLPPVVPGQFPVQVTSAPGRPCVIQTSTNLTSWSIVSSNLMPASGVRMFVDTNANASARGFYRAAVGP